MMKGPTSKQIRFADWLAGLKGREGQGHLTSQRQRAALKGREDRGTLAALRRGLMLEEEQLFELFGYVPPHHIAGLHPGEERLYLMVAALYAYHPESFSEEEEGKPAKRRPNLGESLRAFADKKARKSGGPREGEELLPDSLKRRMDALLSAPRADLFGHLRQVISLLKTEEIPVDWALLLYDLQGWELPQRPVQWRWSRSFYVGYQNEGGDESDVR